MLKANAVLHFVPRLIRQWPKRSALIGVGMPTLLLAVWLLPNFLNQTALTHWAQAQVAQRWGRVLEVDTLHFQLLPRPRLQAKNLRLSNPAWAQQRQLFTAESINAEFGLLALISGDLQIQRLRIDGLRLHLETDAAQRRSWDLAIEHGAPSATTTDDDRKFSIQHLTELRLQDARIDYRSAATAPTAIPEPLQVENLKAKASAGWHAVDLDARIINHQQPLQLQAHLDNVNLADANHGYANGTLTLQSPTAKFSASGTIPLGVLPAQGALALELRASTLQSMLALFGLPGQSKAAINASVNLRFLKDTIQIDTWQLALGQQKLQGAAHWQQSTSGTLIDASLNANQLDWAQMLLDAGRPLPPPKPANELFETHALPWYLLDALPNRIDARIATRIALLKLRSGVELENVAANLRLRHAQLDLQSLTARMLGGSVKANAQLQAAQTIEFNLQLNQASLPAWFAQRHKPSLLQSGILNLSAAATTHGASLKQLAANLNGTVDLDLRNVAIASIKAAEAEALFTGMLPLFGGVDSNRLLLDCAIARLPFRAGRARATTLIDLRSHDSQLSTGGVLDMKSQTLDLKGRIRARSGVSLGLATLADQIRISGPILHPHFALDKTHAASTLARVGAAILTGGASVVGTALWQAATPENDPCAQKASAAAPLSPVSKLRK